jgi:hypothetical protein
MVKEGHPILEMLSGETRELMEEVIFKCVGALTLNV